MLIMRSKVLILSVFAASAVWAISLTSQSVYAAGSYATTLSVDLNDTNTTDGICEATPGLGDCTLRAAIEQGTADNIDTTIVVNTYPGGYTLSLGQLTISTDITLEGIPTARAQIGNITNDSRAIEVVPIGTLTIRSLIISNVTGFNGSGACISNNSRLVMDNVELDNCETSNPGGALATSINSATEINGSLGSGGTFGSMIKNSTGSYGGCIPKRK
jgi:hypothetical protein